MHQRLMTSAFIVTEEEEGSVEGSVKGSVEGSVEGGVRKTAALRACFSCVSINRQCVGR